MELRVLIFLVASLVIILIYPFVLERFGLSPAPTVRPIQPERAASEISPPAKAEAPVEIGSGVPAVAEEIFVIETPLYRATLSNRGGTIRSWVLQRYTAASKGERQAVELVPSGAGFLAPLAVTSDSHLGLENVLFSVQKGDGRIDATHPTTEWVFRYREAAGWVEKRFRFQADRYTVEVELRSEGLGDLVIATGTNFGITDWGAGGSSGYIGPITRVDGVIVKDPIAKIEGETRHAGSLAWIALQDKYFIATLLPEQGASVTLKRLGDKGVTGLLPVATAARLTLYAGPKEYDRLTEFHVGLEDTIDFGWFIYGSWSLVRWIAEPLFFVLRAIQRLTHNYGFAIILLTVMIKGVFIPLTHRSYRAMKRMQELQPQLAVLQKKHSADRDRLNREMMELYRKNRVNPLGGCLPMVVQIPFFVAFFNILSTTIELRGAPFLLWIGDLSLKDPYYVLPIIMGGTMVLQQMLQPTNMDPRQAKAMLMLPVVMTFLFLSFPAGLVLYWLTNNILTITQQYITKQYLDRPAAASPA